MEQKQSFLTSPIAILIGSVIIAVAILISNGVIPVKIGSKQDVKGVAAPTQTPQAQAPAQVTVTLDQIKNVFSKSVIKFGDTNKKLIVIEVSDPSCPYCQIAAGQNSELNKSAGARFTLVSDGGTYLAPVPEIEKLVSSGKAAFAYIYFPGHGNGEMATKALYCAYEKGKFWEVHNLIMSAKGYEIQNGTTVSGAASSNPVVKNDKTKSGDLANFLSPAINPAEMKACLDSGKYDNSLEADRSLAISLNINGTPGFYLNTTIFAGAYSYKEMESAVNAALK